MRYHRVCLDYCCTTTRASRFGNGLLFAVTELWQALATPALAHDSCHLKAWPSGKRMSAAEERFTLLIWRASLTGVLLGGAGTIYFLAGLAGHLLSPLPNLFLAVALAGALFFFLREFLRAFADVPWVGRCLWIAVLILLINVILLCLVPPTARDELTHHLAIPRLYARAGRIFEIPMAPYSYYPMLLDMFYTPWLIWGNDSVPKVVHALFGALTGLLLYAYLARRMNVVYGLLGFFFWISIPSVLRLSHWAYVDLGVVFFTTSALLSLVCWREEKDRRSWLALAGLAAGFAFATKPNGLVACLLLFLLLAWQLARKPSGGSGGIISDLALFGSAVTLACVPWIAKNWYQTGNPFFPLLGGIFGAKGPAASAPAHYVSLGVFAKRELLYGESWWQIAALPLRLFFSGQDDNPQYFDGVLSPLLILLLPWAFKGKWLEEKRWLFAFAALYLAYALFLVDLRARYVLVIVPPLVLLFVYAVFNVYLSLKQPAYLYALLLFFAGWHGFYVYRYFQVVSPVDYLSGNETRAAYLTRVLPEYPAFAYVNRELPRDAKIYLLFIGRRGYYCERNYFHDGGELPAFLHGAINSAREPGQLEKVLRTQGITHLMIRTDLLARYLVENLPPAQVALWNEFARSRLSLNFHERGYALYQLHG
jgi:4-amino-4-deoxy-L-arabinose transferase-like glycosyltransferase